MVGWNDTSLGCESRGERSWADASLDTAHGDSFSRLRGPRRGLTEGCGKPDLGRSQAVPQAGPSWSAWEVVSLGGGPG